MQRILRRLVYWAALGSMLVWAGSQTGSVSAGAGGSNVSAIVIYATPDYVVEPPPEPPTTTPLVTTSTLPPTTTPVVTAITILPTTTTVPPTTITTTAPPTSSTTTTPPTSTTTTPPTSTTNTPPTTTAAPPPTTAVSEASPVLKIDLDGDVTSGALDPDNLDTEGSVSSTGKVVVISLVVEPETNAWKKDGTPLETIEIKTVTIAAFPPLPNNARPLSPVVELGPEGCYFTKSINLTLSYDPELAAGLNQSTLYIACYDGDSVFPLACIVDVKNHTVTATLSRISSIYTILAGAPAEYRFNWWWLATLLVLLPLLFLRRPRLVFASRPQKLAAGEISLMITIETRDALNRRQNVKQDVAIELTSSSATGRFDIRPDGVFDGSVRLVIIPEKSHSAGFYYRDGSPGKPMITISQKVGFKKRARWKPARQQSEINHRQA